MQFNPYLYGQQELGQLGQDPTQQQEFNGYGQQGLLGQGLLGPDLDPTQGQLEFDGYGQPGQQSQDLTQQQQLNGHGQQGQLDGQQGQQQKQKQ